MGALRSEVFRGAALLALAAVAPVALVACKRDAGDVAVRREPSAVSSGSVAVAGSASAAPTAPAIEGRAVPVDVGEHGFTPSSITVKKGELTTLVFTRTSNSTCALSVVFPELKLEKDLPYKKPVAVPVPTDENRTIGFQCGMAMYKSKVVVQ